MVIDVQRDVVANALDTSRVVGDINELVAKARTSGTPVIWVQHSDDYLIKGSEGWEFVPELVPGSDEAHVYKTRANSFTNTDLAEQLERLGTKRLVITGAQTDYCVNATSNAAVDFGFDVTLVSDAHTTENTPTATAAELIAAKNEQFSGLHKDGQTIAVIPTAEVTF